MRKNKMMSNYYIRIIVIFLSLWPAGMCALAAIMLALGLHPGCLPFLAGLIIYGEYVYNTYKVVIKGHQCDKNSWEPEDETK